MSGLYEVNGSTLRLHLHPGQLRAWESISRVVAIVAGTQSGKTSFLPLWLWREIRLRGPGDYGFVSPSFSLMELKALPEFKRLFEKVFRLGRYVSSPVRRFTVSPDGEVALFGRRQPEPTRIYFGYAENPDSLESSTYKAAVADEAGQKSFRRESYEAIRRRLSIHQGRLCIATTPYGATGWLKTEIFDRHHTGDVGVDLIQFASVMNPAFPRAEYERARASLPAWKFALFYRGELARPAGLIYDCFDTAANTCPRFAIPLDWPRYLGLDFGGVNTAGVFIAEELAPLHGPPRPGKPPLAAVPTGRLYAYRVYPPGGSRTAREHVAELLRGEPRRPTVVGGSASEGQWRAEFAAAGLAVKEPPIREVEVGIQRVYGALQRRELVFFDDLGELLDDLGAYSRAVDETGQATEKIEAKETWHRLDALRYVLAHLRGGKLPAGTWGLERV